MKEKLLVIVGPTAVGKTALSIEIAKKFHGEIISGDSMQVYQGMNIGTAKITEQEKEGIPHHMLDILDPAQPFSVADFQTLVQQYIQEIAIRGRQPIIAGGTGLYIQSVLYDYQFADSRRSAAYQQKIEQELEQNGLEYVYNRLKRVDPVQAEKIHPNNIRRLVRALEVYDRTGLTMTEYQARQSAEARYDFHIIGLQMERELLYQRINQRVDLMIENGLIEEVAQLLQKGYEGTQAMRGIGYKEIIPYVKGEQSLEEAVDTLKRNSRRFAKRQYTWFNNKMPVHWYEITPETSTVVFQNILTDLEGFYSFT
ncbi:tRNA (adenosine(37)-N6)-dimethylallyltransferase MiaA [Gracilibacillus alcaliphilus]|uniref:tRNA (adenosine(37)-N6)-dimethylallyltransferase MiaA n=1 Tax=Gracilibacillus alcaliphilus TaxID=1401441 RepID=UPI0019566E6E|nr:tRNA (adenosine(37)-N6)-dimethylallyltransferase MiaA [Gracilibacillus alcaliphilus]MBM7676639.1 tRNA dimethylallyltransferase [Gracilibacillus alcaliphilus]